MMVNHHNHDVEGSVENAEKKKKEESCQISESTLCHPSTGNGTSGLLESIHNGENLHHRREDLVGKKGNLLGGRTSQHVNHINSEHSKEESEKSERGNAQKGHTKKDTKRETKRDTKIDIKIDTNGDTENGDQREVASNELSKQKFCEGPVDHTQGSGTPQHSEQINNDHTIKMDDVEGAQDELQIEAAHVPPSDAADALPIEEYYLQKDSEDESLRGTLYGSIIDSLNSSQIGSHNDSQSNPVNNPPQDNHDETVEAVVAKEEMINITRLYHTGINKIEAAIALYRYYKNNFNQRFREQMNKYNPLIYFYSNNNFEDHISVDYINYKDKMNAMKTERLSRLVLYIEDINQIKQALKVKQLNELKLEDDEKKEYFYDANEDIEDFFIFDNTVSYLNNDVESIFSEAENSSFFKDDASIDNFLEEQKNKTNDEFNMPNLFNRFSLKNHDMFDINKNLCAIYARTPMIIKKFAEKINSYSSTEKTHADLDGTKQDGVNFPREHKNKENYNYYPAARSRENNQNLDAYIQFHCDKWQENMYDIVEVNSLEFDFNRLRCNIM
ncbi:hypothetical protein C922_00491 [Plasmodium inui San Antonio 1]|uniref:Uncharacterized protein n=1 Tax=Plasmodium inui San Antonio 1 TaxID=1237626 RepID=W7ABV4_9APIC|nr:hypothetical protein C922_00491 [Plasmodium inui San Antonio 1]EUD68803.1 hypothetical protein C922_00491 [Plasmodium inui San Antonio 1]